MSKPPKPAYALTDAEQRDHLPSFPRLIGAEDRRARASRTAIVVATQIPSFPRTACPSEGVGRESSTTIVVATHLPSFPRKRESSTGHA